MYKITFGTVINELASIKQTDSKNDNLLITKIQIIMKYNLISFIAILLLVSNGIYAQKKCKYKIDKYDDFTNEQIVMTKYADLGLKSILLSIDYQLGVASKLIKSKADTSFYLIISVYKKGLSEKDNPYRINKDDKCILVLSNDDRLILSSVDNDLGKKYDGNKIGDVVMDYNCYVYGTYLIPKEELNKLKSNEIVKCRIEVNGGVEWEEKINLDVDVTKTESGIKINDRDNVMEQLECLMQKL